MLGQMLSPRRSANSFSNGEIISFADEFSVLGDVAGEKLELMKPRQDGPGIGRPPHDPPDRLLHRLDFKTHGRKLPGSTRRVNQRASPQGQRGGLDARRLEQRRNAAVRHSV